MIKLYRFVEKILSGHKFSFMCVLIMGLEALLQNFYVSGSKAGGLQYVHCLLMYNKVQGYIHVRIH